MGGYLRQATASQSRALGPFISDSDFKTVQTGLTIANTDIKLVVNGGASANKNSGGGTHLVNGVYGVTFDATDTATVGEMEVSVVVSGALVVFDKFTIVEEAVYDMLFAASALGYIANAPVNVAQFGGSNGTFASGRPEVNTTHFGGSALTQSGGRPEVNTTLIEGTDATNQIRDSVVDDATRIDASALNTLSSHDPGETIMGATDLGTGSGLTSLATATELAKVPKSDSNVTWNATAAAQLQSEANDALVANGLDHLIGASVTGTDVTDNSIIAKMVSKSATADWDSFTNTTDALEAIRDKETDIETDTAEIGAAGAGLTALASATEMAKVPKSDSNVTFNATAAAQFQSEANDALVAYDPPTRAEATSDKDEVLAAVAVVDGVADAIKLKTDQLAFTAAGHVNSNMLKINGTTVNGDGAGTPWGP